MLYLITGANGAGKTLNTLKWVRERSVKENRPVCHNGRFEPVEGGELSTWKKAEFKDWQDEPDGTIFLVDECHNDLPLRSPSVAVPDHVKMLAEHRRRGFDFYLVTQHPQNIDNFVRRLIGSPGWHRHLKRTFGADLVSCIEWNAVNPNCEKDGSSRTGTVTMTPFPKEVYTWYKSASLHTGKKRIPKMVYVLLAAVLVIILASFFGVKMLRKQTGMDENLPAQADKTGSVFTPGAPGTSRPTVPTVKTSEDYLSERTARIPDFPHSAPIYDAATAPVTAPYPAACVLMKNVCRCYTQQATVLNTSQDICNQIVKNGYFVDWQLPTQREADDNRNRPDRQLVTAAPQNTPLASVPLPMPAERPEPRPTYSEALALRNSQVKSSIGKSQ